ncbi:MAG: hypothetical protein HUU20_06910 [Pirellulales bacterium]|nr:hypothetical protein [Pirellulales bacterium]
MIENNPTNLMAAFDMLLEEIEAEIEFTAKTGARAFEARDYDRAREALERAARITAFREKADTLRREWEAIVGTAEDEDEEDDERVSRRDLGRLARGLRTGEDAYRVPILEALAGMGGSGAMSEVLERICQSMRGVLKDVDFEPLASDPALPRWRNTACWARNAMVKEGLLKGDSRRGVWEISELGRRLLAERAAG